MLGLCAGCGLSEPHLNFQSQVHSCLPECILFCCVSIMDCCGLKPTTVKDNVGICIVVSCGSVSGCLYLNKLDVSNKQLTKCILFNELWHTPLYRV